MFRGMILLYVAKLVTEVPTPWGRWRRLPHSQKYFGCRHHGLYTYYLHHLIIWKKTSSTQLSQEVLF